jgi:hypothetical protein
MQRLQQHGAGMAAAEAAPASCHLFKKNVPVAIQQQQQQQQQSLCSSWQELH